jgi:hypothetical protein
MTDSENAAPPCWPSYFTGEYARIGVSINKNMSLSAPVLINVLTGVMHADNSEGGLLCEKRVTWRTETHGVLRSLSSVAFRACRNCEKIVKANAQISGGTSSAEFDCSASKDGRKEQP